MKETRRLVYLLTRRHTSTDNKKGSLRIISYLAAQKTTFEVCSFPATYDFLSLTFTDYMEDCKRGYLYNYQWVGQCLHKFFQHS